MFKQLLIGLVCSVLSFSAIAGKKETPESLEGATVITAAEVIDLIGKFDDLVLIDSRKISDLEKGFIEGAISLPNTDTDNASLAKIIPTKATPVIFYCNGSKCGRSYKAAVIAIKAGYVKVFWFRNGITEWESQGFPIVR